MLPGVEAIVERFSEATSVAQTCRTASNQGGIRFFDELNPCFSGSVVLQ